MLMPININCFMTVSCNFRNFVLNRSLVDLAGSKHETEELENIVREMYDYAGLSDKDELDFVEFKQLLTSKDENFMEKVGVDWKGLSAVRPIFFIAINIDIIVRSILDIVFLA